MYGLIACIVAWLIGLVRLRKQVWLAYAAPILGVGLSAVFVMSIFLPPQAFEHYGNGEQLMGAPFLGAIGTAISLVMLAITATTHGILTVLKRRGR